MVKLNLTLPDGELPVTGKQVTFFSNQSSGNVSHIIIQGIEFALVDSTKNHPGGYAFYANTMVSVILNVEQKYAYIQNSAGNSYVDAQFPLKIHNHTAEQIRGGTFGGLIKADSSVKSYPGDAFIRNTSIVEKGSMYENSTELVEGEIMWLYE